MTKIEADYLFRMKKIRLLLDEFNKKDLEKKYFHIFESSGFRTTN